MNQQEINQRHKKFDFTWARFIEKKRFIDGMIFDKYQIIEKIGNGQYGVVYRAIILESKLQVAIKIINLREIETEKNPKLRLLKKRMAQSQSRIMMQFDSVNIIKCYQCFQSQDFKFMILEYCNGGSLMSKIQKQKQIPEDQSIAILKQIINGIVECHKQKIIHRDIKPDNILIHNGVYKIADFGFSKSLNIKNENQTCMNTTLGTMTTMAPEVISRKPYGLKADIWSIGVIFFNMIFGECPYTSVSDHAKITKILNKKLIENETYKGVKPSKKVKKFIMQVLVVEINDRLGWKQMANHAIFQQDQQLRNSFIRKIQLEKIDDEVLKIQKQLILLQKSQDISMKQNSQFIEPEMKKQIAEKSQIQMKQMKMEQKPDNFQKNAQRRMNKQNINEQNYLRTEKKYSDEQMMMRNQQKMMNNEQKMMRNEQTQSDQIKQRQSQKQRQQQKDQIKFKTKSLAQINEYQIRLINDQQKQLYEWARKTHIECLKTQVIFKKVIKVIQEQNLINLKQRESIEFMYLLSTRCFNNMSPIKFQYSIYTASDILKELNETVDKLYNEVSEKWMYYCSLLTSKENEKMQIASDWTKRIFLSKLFPSKYKYSQKQKFMTGIECMIEFRTSLYEYEMKYSVKKESMRKQQEQSPQQKALKDYTKQQQIEYTVEYMQSHENIFPKDKSQQLSNVLKYLKHYKQICCVSLQQLSQRTFKKYVQQLIK